MQTIPTMFITRLTHILILICCLPFVYSCNKRPEVVTKDELIVYLAEAKALNPSIERNNVQMTVKYQPQQLLIQREWEHSAQNDTSLLQQLKHKYAEHYYFVLELSSNNKEALREVGDFSRYSDMVQVLSFQMLPYINITTNKRDTVAMTDYVFEQNYGIGNANRLLLVFPANKIAQAEKYELNIREFGMNTGNVNFSFRRKDIQLIPSLRYSVKDKRS